MNVIFIVLDTLRKDRVMPYTESTVMNNLGTFAQDAQIFMNAVANAPWTLPSQASMFTGLYPWEHGATQKKLFLETDQQMMAEMFQDEGYRTGCFTANMWISPYAGMTKGFDEVDNMFPALPKFIQSFIDSFWRELNSSRFSWLSEKMLWVLDRIGITGERKHSVRAEEVREKAENFVSRCMGGDFFLFINFMEAHTPYYPPEEYLEKHAPGIDPRAVCQFPSEHNGGIREAEFDKLEKLYDAEVDYLDDQLGELFSFLRDNELLDDTVVVVASDHGENLGEDGMFGHQFSVSEQLVSVPLIVHVPGRESGRVEKQVELRELYRLIPYWAGIGEEYEYGTEYAKGGYEYPRLDLRNIPKNRKQELGRALRFVRGKGRKLVKEGETMQMIDLETGEALEIDSVFADLVSEIGEAEEGRMLEDQDELIKERLEDLGYL